MGTTTHLDMSDMFSSIKLESLDDSSQSPIYVNGVSLIMIVTGYNAIIPPTTLYLGSQVHAMKTRPSVAVLLADNQCLYNVAINVVKRRREFASLAVNAVLCTFDSIRLGWCCWAAMTENALNVLTTASMYTRGLSSDVTKGSQIGFGRIILMAIGVHISKV